MMSGARDRQSRAETELNRAKEKHEHERARESGADALQRKHRQEDEQRAAAEKAEDDEHKRQLARLREAERAADANRGGKVRIHKIPVAQRTGFQNWGSTCYINAGLQALLRTNWIVNMCQHRDREAAWRAAAAGGPGAGDFGSRCHMGSYGDAHTLTWEAELMLSAAFGDRPPQLFAQGSLKTQLRMEREDEEDDVRRERQAKPGGN